MSAWDIQTGIYSALAGDAPLMAMVQAIYDDVPQATDSGSDAAFPYITIGQDTLTEWGTDTNTGFDATITVHVWSRYRGRKEAKEIQAAVYAVLHRQEIILDDYHLVLLDEQLQQVITDPDGITRHGVQQYRGLFRTLEA